MSLRITPKVSSVVKYQIPETIRNQNDKLVLFLEEYYRFMESLDNPLDIIRNLQNEFDPDTTGYFLNILKSHVFPYSMENADAVIEDEYLIKFIRELYLKKGTADSFKYIFDKLYNVESDIDYGRNYVFRTSDNQYQSTSHIIIKAPGIYLGDILDGKVIYQGVNSVTVQSFEMYACSKCKVSVVGTIDKDSYVIKNTDVSAFTVGDVLVGDGIQIQKFTQVVEITDDTVVLNKPIVGEYINKPIDIYDAYYKCYIDSNKIYGSLNENKSAFINSGDSQVEVSIISLINRVEVTEPGSLYIAGQKLKVIGGSGGQLRLSVNSVSAGSIDEIIIHDPGIGYSVGDKILFNDPTKQGKGAEAIVSAIDGYGAEIKLSYNVDTVAIKSPGTGYNVNDLIPIDLNTTSGDKLLLRVTAVDSNEKQIRIVNGGSGYYYARAIFSVDSTFVYTTAKIKNGIIIEVPLPPGTLDVYSNNGHINGAGCYGTASVTSGTLSFTAFLDHGYNYVAPQILIKSGGEVIDTVYSNPTYNSEFGITAFSNIPTFLANGSYQFEVVESYGNGYSSVISSVNSLTGIEVELNVPFYEFSHVHKQIYDPNGTTAGTGAEFFVYANIASAEIIDGGKYYLNPSIDLVSINGSGFEYQLEINAGAISAVNILNSGASYPHDSTIIVSEGTDAVLVPVINDLGQIIRVVVENGGSGYSTDSELTVVTGQIQPTVLLNQTAGVIDSTVVTNNGSKLFSSVDIVLSDVNNAFTSISCTTVNGSNLITTTGNAFANVDIGDKVYHEVSDNGINGFKVIELAVGGDINVIALDQNIPITFGSSTTFYFVKPHGRISKVDILDGGFGYKELPYVVLPNKDDGDDSLWNDFSPARLIPTSKSIGKVLSYAIEDSGLNYYQVPLISTPVTGILKSYNKTLIRNELIYDPTYAYEDGNYLKGPHARVKRTDFSKGLLFLDDATDIFDFYTEYGIPLISENETVLTHEQSFPIEANKVYRGTESGTEFEFYQINRASALAHSGAIVTNKPTFVSNNGFTSDPFIKLHDGKRIQDYAYYIKVFDKLIDNIKVALNLQEYKANISEMVHPAGYKMYGDLHIENMIKVPFNLWSFVDAQGNPIGPNIVLKILLDFGNLYREQLLNVSYSDGSRLRHDLLIILDEVIKEAGYFNIAEELFELFVILEPKLIPEVVVNSQPMVYEINKVEEVGYTFLPEDLEEIKFVEFESDIQGTWDSLEHDVLENSSLTNGFFGNTVFEDFNNNTWGKLYRSIVPNTQVIVVRTRFNEQFEFTDTISFIKDLHLDISESFSMRETLTYLPDIELIDAIDIAAESIAFSTGKLNVDSFTFGENLVFGINKYIDDEINLLDSGEMIMPIYADDYFAEEYVYSNKNF